MTLDITWLDAGPNTRPRDKQLSRALANSHVARHTHRKRIARRRPPTRRSKASRSGTSSPSKANPLPLYYAFPVKPSSHVSDQQCDTIIHPSTGWKMLCAVDRSSSSSVTVPESDHHSSQTPAPFSNWRTIASGNSDPFACMPISITPEVNDIIAFFHFRMLHLVTFTTGNLDPAKAQLLKRVASSFIHETNTFGLIDTCSARGFLVFIGAFRAVFTQDLRSNLQYKALELESQTTLRSRLETASNIDNNVLYCVMAHFVASVVSQDIPAAICHGEFLRGLLVPKIEADEPLRNGLFRQAIWADAQLSIMRLQRSILNADTWLHKILDPIYKELKSPFQQLPKYLFLPNSFNSTILSSPIYKSIHRLRQVFTLSKALSNTIISSGTSSFLFMSCSLCYSQLNLINHYLDITAALHATTQPMSFTQRHHARVEATLIIAILHLTDRFCHYFYPSARYVSKADRLLPTLQSHISQLQTYTSEPNMQGYGGDDDHDYSDAYIFVLFVEAQAERWLVIEDSKRGRQPFSCDCDVELARMAKLKGLKNWHDLQRVPGMFLYTDIVKPLGSDWVGELLGG